MSEGNGFATREMLFGSPPVRRYCEVAIDGLGKFRIRSLNDKEKSGYNAEAINKDGKFNRHAAISANARLVALCCVDGDGNRVFTADDVPKLQELDSGLVEELAEACRKHCGFGETEDAVKNSD